MEKGLYKALDLACYINDKYQKVYGTSISNIKLQKSLYLLFAYWGGFIRKSKDGNVEENLYNRYKECLFDDRIEAWTYGPVIPKVYHDFTNYYDESKILNIQTILKANEFVKSFIDDLLNEIFPLSDFKLVDISHEDRCWIRNYDYKEKNHNKEIPKEEIIDEYSTK